MGADGPRFFSVIVVLLSQFCPPGPFFPAVFGTEFRPLGPRLELAVPAQGIDDDRAGFVGRLIDVVRDF
ncbi:MAG: hypothetical protein MPJ22_00095, partial [Pirellulales bacterium]|nr:hypothetical protein [Pirellulales bacterium]